MRHQCYVLIFQSGAQTHQLAICFAIRRIGKAIKIFQHHGCFCYRVVLRKPHPHWKRKWVESYPPHLLFEVHDQWFVWQGREGEGMLGGGLTWINTTLAMYTIQSLSLCIIVFQRFVAKWPGRRSPTMM